MTVEQLAYKLTKLRSNLQGKEIVIRAENGLLLEPSIKMILESEYDLTSDVDKVIITY